MTTTTNRQYASFPIEAGATRDDIINGFMAATREIQTVAEKQGATILWDMTHFEYVEEERSEVSSITSAVTEFSAWPARLIVSTPLVVTT